MTKRQLDRITRLLPNGEPQYVRIYDHGEESKFSDHITVIFSGNYTSRTGGEHVLIGMSCEPFHPQGICMTSQYPYQCDTLGPNGEQGARWGGVSIGRRCHLGKRIPFSELNDDCQRATLQTYCDIWEIPLPESVAKPSVSIASD